MMTKEQQPTDYFFIVQTDRPFSIDKNEVYPDVDIFAQGSGMEIVESLARTAVLVAAQDHERFSYRSDRDTVMPLLRALPSNKAGQLDVRIEPFEPLEGRIDINPYVAGNFFDYKFLHKLHEKHKEAVYNQVRDGYRSPADAAEEFMTAESDQNTLVKARHAWFDNTGRKILAPSYREGATQKDKRRAQLDLRRITRSAAAHLISPDTRTVLFDQVPEKAKAFSVDVLPLRNEHYWIDPDRLFYGGKMLVHKTFGYVEKGSQEFVPVVTELSPEHPVRKSDQ